MAVILWYIWKPHAGFPVTKEGPEKGWDGTSVLGMGKAQLDFPAVGYLGSIRNWELLSKDEHNVVKVPVALNVLSNECLKGKNPKWKETPLYSQKQVNNWL